MTELLVLNIVEGLIQAVSLDGSRVRTVADGLDEYPDGIVVDQRRGHIYWTNMGTPDPGQPEGGEITNFGRSGSLERVDFDGRNRRTIVPRGGFTTGKQLTADFAEGKLYWCDREGMQVLRCDLDGSHLEPLVVVATGDEAARDSRNHCVGIAIDPRNRLVYWTQKGSTTAAEGRIFRAPIDTPSGRTAADRDDIDLLFARLPQPIDLHLDGRGSLAWTERGVGSAGNTLNRATIAPRVGAPEVCSHGYKDPIGLTTPDGITYYVCDTGGSIREVNLADGIDRELVHLNPSLCGMTLAEL
ncbi:hypothetical protein [Nocardia transvalensis]|uniref:hypothetical protein n=1 Tax=Nocardia transvalensis TaxID=37333 RepID=UPI00189303B9|nr:hypothetical protein [Nocardia transvalensis]MBF6330308.1 hypothetical protein [Nocardia transvalensis]